MSESFPRYISDTPRKKWDYRDCDAVTDFVKGGSVAGSVLAYPYSYMVRSLGEGIYDAVNSIGIRVYGGPDDTGSVDGEDAQAVLQAAINAIRGTVNHALTGLNARVNAHGTLAFNGDFPLTSGNIDMCDLDGLTIFGNGCTLTIQTNDSVVFDCTNSANIKVYNLIFEVDATYHPDVVWLFSRDNSGASCEFNRFVDCIFTDTGSAGCDVSLVYNHASELMTFTRCYFRHDKNGFIFTGSNRDSIASSYKTIAVGGSYSCRNSTFSSCSFTKTNWETKYPYYSVILEGQGETCFDDNCYFSEGDDTGAVDGNFAFYVDLTNNAGYSLNVTNSKFEGKVITCGGASILQTLMGFKFTNNYFHREADDDSLPYFDLNKTNTQLSNWTMQNNIFHTGLSFELDLPLVTTCKFDFSTCWAEPTVTFADFYDTDLVMWTKANATFTTFHRGTVRFLLNKGGTKSSGRSTGTGGEQTIAHSLVAIPNRIYLTLVYNSDTPPYVSTYQDGTNIYITAPLNMDYYWVAEVTYPD